MKGFFFMVLLLGVAVAAVAVPIGDRTLWARAQERGIPAAVLRATAHGLRAGWDAIASLGEHASSSKSLATREAPAHSPAKPPSRKVQAGARPVHRASREGIVAQPPKERLEPTDRDALNALVAKTR